MSPEVAIWPAVTSPGPVALSCSRLGLVALHLERDLLHVEDEVGDVLADSGEAAELVQHALDADRGHRGALERRQQHPPQRVAERQPEAALQRLGDEGRAAARVAAPGLLLERVGLLHFLPVLCVDGHVVPLAVGETRPPPDY
jgi:hypothetical protein